MWKINLSGRGITNIERVYSGDEFLKTNGRNMGLGDLMAARRHVIYLDDFQVIATSWLAEIINMLLKKRCCVSLFTPHLHMLVYAKKTIERSDIKVALFLLPYSRARIMQSTTAW